MVIHIIPKLKVTKVGYIDKEGNPAGFSFCGKGIENSVGHFFDSESGLYLCAGYTIDELKEMCK